MKIDGERHTHKKKKCTFFDSSKGIVPLATVLSVIVRFGAADGPPRPWALCSHITGTKTSSHHSLLTH